ncbi:MAG: SPOR domain-containing protein [Alphaproteobacteria bacterium]
MADTGLPKGAIRARPPFLKRFGWLTGIVAGVTLAGFAVATWYAYTIGMRTGSEGAAPLVRADGRPEKIRPADPGGMEVPHQDKSVFGRVKSEENKNEAARNIEQLLPPPEEPVQRPKAKDKPAEGQKAEALKTDNPSKEGPPVAGAAQTPTGPQSTPSTPPPSAPVPSPPAPGQAKLPEIKSAEVKPQETKPLDPKNMPTPLVVPQPAAEKKSPEAQTAAPPATGLPENTAPSTRPAAPKATPSPSPVAKTAKGGAYRIQLAATRTEDEAQAEIAKLRAKHGAVLGNVALSAQRADLGEKGIFYRIQGGPFDAEGAKAACAALRQQNLGCILVRP